MVFYLACHGLDGLMLGVFAFLLLVVLVSLALLLFVLACRFSEAALRCSGLLAAGLLCCCVVVLAERALAGRFCGAAEEIPSLFFWGGGGIHSTPACGT